MNTIEDQIRKRVSGIIRDSVTNMLVKLGNNPKYQNKDIGEFAYFIWDRVVDIYWQTKSFVEKSDV